MHFRRKPHNYLTMIPAHNIEEFNDIEGKITLLIPRFKKEWLRKWLIPKRKSPYFKIHLDENGSHIWRLINGKRTVEEICIEMNNIHKSNFKSIEQVEERVTSFMTNLYKNRFIIFDEKNTKHLPLITDL